MRCTLVAAVVLVQAVMGVRHAHAQSDGAEERFVHGVAELKAGRFENACPALEESYASDPRLGTLLALADCFERWGKAHSATTRYEQYLEQALALGPDERARRAQQLEFARAALERTRAQVAHLVLATPPGAPSPRVLLDQRELTLVPEQPVAVDPGRHVLETSAEGHRPWRITLDLAAGEQRRVLLDLGPEAEQQPVPLTSVAAPVAAEATPTPARGAQSADFASAASEVESPWRTVGWTLGGVGVAGIAVGTVAGILVLDACPGLKCEDSQRDEVRTRALVSDVGFGLGLVSLVASAAVLIGTTPPAHPSNTATWQPRVVAGRSGAWIGVGQRW